MQFQNSQFVKRLSRLVAPLCKNNSIPTLTASGCGGSLESIAGCRRENQACVIEVWEGPLGLRPVTTTRKKLDLKVHALKKCPDKERILEVVDVLKDNQYLRIRRLTPEECLRFMGVNEEHINRMMNPYESLLKNGYTEEQIRELVHSSRKGFKFSDYALYGRAGNSIIVNVIAAIFSKVLEYGWEKDSQGCQRQTLSLPEPINAMTAKEKRRKYSRDYYLRHKEEICRKSREYHCICRKTLKLKEEAA